MPQSLANLYVYLIFSTKERLRSDQRSILNPGALPQATIECPFGAENHDDDFHHSS